MSKSSLMLALAGGGLLLGAGLAWRRASPPLPEPQPNRGLVPILDPLIHMRTAERVLAQLDPLSDDDEVTVLLHTGGGLVTASVMIADALRRFRRSRAIVPYMALSGGTLIALNTRRLEMGRAAALSAVDPVIDGWRAKHIPERSTKLHAHAQEAYQAISRYLEETLTYRLGDPRAVARAMPIFLGHAAPHSWPVRTRELAALGLDVSPAESQWSALVDEARLSVPHSPMLGMIPRGIRR